MTAQKLNVVVAFRKQHGHRFPLVTDITVRMGNDPVAQRTIPGRWNQDAAFQEFKRFPERFNAVGVLTAAQLKLVAA